VGGPAEITVRSTGTARLPFAALLRIVSVPPNIPGDRAVASTVIDTTLLEFGNALSHPPPVLVAAVTPEIVSVP
jgi:hypothetical protein